MIGLEFLDMPGIIGENPNYILKQISFRDEAVYYKVLEIIPECKKVLQFNDTVMKALGEALIQEARDYPTMLSTAEDIAEFVLPEVIQQASKTFYNRFKVNTLLT